MFRGTQVGSKTLMYLLCMYSFIAAHTPCITIETGFLCRFTNHYHSFQCSVSFSWLLEFIHHHHVVFLTTDHSPFKGEFFRECDLVLPLSTYRIFSVLECHSVAAYVL